MTTPHIVPSRPIDCALLVYAAEQRGSNHTCHYINQDATPPWVQSARLPVNVLNLESLNGGSVIVSHASCLISNALKLCDEAERKLKAEGAVARAWNNLMANITSGEKEERFRLKSSLLGLASAGMAEGRTSLQRWQKMLSTSAVPRSLQAKQSTHVCKVLEPLLKFAEEGRNPPAHKKGKGLDNLLAKNPSEIAELATLAYEVAPNSVRKATRLLLPHYLKAHQDQSGSIRKTLYQALIKTRTKLAADLAPELLAK